MTSPGHYGHAGFIAAHWLRPSPPPPVRRCPARPAPRPRDFTRGPTRDSADRAAQDLADYWEVWMEEQRALEAEADKL